MLRETGCGEPLAMLRTGVDAREDVGQQRDGDKHPFGARAHHRRQLEHRERERADGDGAHAQKVEQGRAQDAGEQRDRLGGAADAGRLYLVHAILVEHHLIATRAADCKPGVAGRLCVRRRAHERRWLYNLMYAGVVWIGWCMAHRVRQTCRPTR
eukprot:7279855-Prymnesium_polylepis.1